MRSLSVLMFSVLLLSSCQMVNPSPSTILTNSTEKQLMFFSDENNLQKEGNYYDALLEIKKKYPNQVTQMKVIPSSEKVRYANFEVSTYPTLLVIKENVVITQIEGELSKEEIIKPLEIALSN
ncbi:thioredoxin domain-containing protein [Cytobacillus sp. S13-E01]|uniref:thioredoxin domain-containing protein n=1 Tax=Cytobacillus sp. S13-E01 TaxID=3031326 RepID=UPI0023D7BD12|nr:thioredoxin domain-containing protein [Cytobacillus sp. S13-E01]MDF0725351.1 thioredoxin domain-containing protein [Cytobacillus sp. S13-E01]